MVDAHNIRRDRGWRGILLDGAWEFLTPHTVVNYCHLFQLLTVQFP